MPTTDQRLPVTVLSGFLGAGIDWLELKARLDAALVPENQAQGPGALPDLPDPFPVWRRADAAE